MFGKRGSEVEPASAAPVAVLSEETAATEKPDGAEFAATKASIYQELMEQIDLATASNLPREELKRQIIELIGEIVVEKKLPMNHAEQQLVAGQIVDDMLGLGPLEPLLRDELVTDIMVNGPRQVYVERRGKLELTGIEFRDEAHLLTVAQRIVTAVGRRVDESTPVCDARLMDGSRVNVIIPPLALKGTTLSIRKFSQKKITLDIMAAQNNISPNLCKVLKICAKSRLNIVISGGTGSGKTTLLNALSQMIDHGERIVTVEDAAELAVAAAACGAAGNASGQPRRQGRNYHARPGEKRPAHAAGPDYPG